MTECNRTPITFSTHDRRRPQADFSGGVLTSDPGLLLLREADRPLGPLDAFDRSLPDPRHPDLIKHPPRALLAQRVFAIAAGYEDLNDHHRLRHDPLWQAATDHPGPDDDPALASAPTLCRLESRIDRRTLFRLSAALVEQSLAAHPTPPEEVVLDFAATDDPAHGHQENRFFHGYHDGPCFLPSYVFCGDHLLVAYLRPSNIDAPRHSRAVLKLLAARLRQAWPAVRIVVRAGSGFCRWRLMRRCDRHQVGSILGLARNAVLERHAADWQRQAHEAYQADPTAAHRAYGEFGYAAATWGRPRRVITKAEHLPGGKANPRFVVTSLVGTPQELYERVYCARGQGGPGQGAAGDAVRGPDERPRVRGQPVPGAAGGGRLGAGVARAAVGAGGHGAGAGGGGDDPAAAVQGGGVGGAERAAGGGADVERLPVAGVVPGGGGPAVRPALRGGAGGAVSAGNAGGRRPPGQRLWG